MKELRDLTQVYESQKALQTTADRLIRIALQQAPAMTRTKAAVPAIGTGDAPAFTSDPDAIPLQSLVQRRSVPGRLLGLGAVAVPANRRIPTTTDDLDTTWTAEGYPAPLARLSTTSTYTGATSYFVLLAFTKEYHRLGDGRARNLVLTRATRGMVKGDDRTFLGDDAATAAQPAGILVGRSPVGAGSPNDLQSDLEQLYSVVVDGAAMSPVFVLSGRAALYLSASGLQAFKDLGVTGGTISGAPALISPSAGANLILIDASELAITDDGVETSLSDHAVLQMVDNPTSGAANVVSAFQTGVSILKFERFLSWALLRDDAVGYLTLPIGGSPA